MKSVSVRPATVDGPPPPLSFDDPTCEENLNPVTVTHNRNAAVGWTWPPTTLADSVCWRTVNRGKLHQVRKPLPELEDKSLKTGCDVSLSQSVPSLGDATPDRTGDGLSRLEASCIASRRDLRRSADDVSGVNPP